MTIILAPGRRRPATRCFPWATLLALCLAAASCLLVVDSDQRHFELKFQLQLDGQPKLVKLEGKQQTFKCQIRLAGHQALAAASTYNYTRHQLSSSSRILPQTGTGLSKPVPSNVSLAIEWFKDSRPIVGQLDDVGVLNVELKGNKDQQQASDKSKNRTRIEIKNTLNGQQMKLTSRLRIDKLRVRQDTGRYKCLARASFQLQAPEQPTTDSTSGGLMQIEQTLDSSESELLVMDRASVMAQNNSSSGPSGPASHELNLSRSQQHQGRRPSPASRRYNDANHANSNLQLPTSSQATSLQSIDLSSSPAMAQPTDPMGVNHTFGGDTSDRDDYEQDNAALNGTLRQQLGLQSTKQGSSQMQGLFEDDEDLFRPSEQSTLEFISGQESSVSSSQSPPSIGSSDSYNYHYNEPALDELNEQPTGILPQDKASPTVWSPANNKSPKMQIYPTNADASLEAPLVEDTYELANGSLASSEGQRSAGAPIKPETPPSRVSGSRQLIGGTSSALDSTRRRLAKLVHRIAPELSCFTGLGEHYRGNVSVSSDGRPCLPWWRLKNLVQLQHNNKVAKTRYRAAMAPASEALDSIGHHNHCRNPNSDPRGLWCLVAHDWRLDDQPRVQQPYARWVPMDSSPEVARHPAEVYVSRSCAVSACSDYLWLYIVAPPVGLMALVSCLVAALIRSVRRSSYKSMMNSGSQCSGGSTGQPAGGKQRRSPVPRLTKLLSSCRRAGATNRKKVAASSGGYLDDDIFEIVDELDWTDARHCSPKSSESLRLSSAASPSPVVIDSQILSGSKSQYHLQTEEPTGKRAIANSLMASELSTGGKGKPANAKISRSITQVGPMFATLRCHIRGPASRPTGLVTDSSFKPSPLGPTKQPNGNSTFIEHWDLAASAGQLQSNRRLISTSSADQSCGEIQSISTSELPQLDPSHLVLAKPTDQQPIYEGKFNLVQSGYLQKINQKAKESKSLCRVAICLAKKDANDQLDLSNLRVRNLNHLNLTKLIGFIRVTDNHESPEDDAAASMLVYDIEQLVDLGEWLQQQNNELMASNEQAKDSMLRRNLACCSKQIALAIDYLHDRDILYKDLACRNCLLDPIKMLVKLASFNLEPLIGDESQGDYATGFMISSPIDKALTQRENANKKLACQNDEPKYNKFSFMIRPKYLQDYYVIDSRPSDSQLMPLSWIPLESILFNKFNKQTDIWSFGCLLYELFSLGKVAYFGYSSKQVIDAIRANLMPPQPLLCPNGIYKLMCKCLSDIPTLRPNVKQIYEQLNLHSGQCSSFLDHHLCSLTPNAIYDEPIICTSEKHPVDHLIELRQELQSQVATKISDGPLELDGAKTASSLSKTRSCSNMRHHLAPQPTDRQDQPGSDPSHKQQQRPQQQQQQQQLPQPGYEILLAD